MRPETFFDLADFAHRDLFAECGAVWDALTHLKRHLRRHLRPNAHLAGCIGKPLPETVVIHGGRAFREGFTIIGGNPVKGAHRVVVDGEETTGAVVLHAGCVLWDDAIELGPGTVVEPGVLLKGPSVFGPGTDIRQGAYVRGVCITGRGCVVGHATEMKASVMLDGAKAGHFAYVGDSILGNAVNLGAGTKLANLKMRGDTIRVRIGGEQRDTGLRKFGAVIGDGTEIGCNAVTNPGTLLGKRCIVFPTASVAAAYYEPRSLIRG